MANKAAETPPEDEDWREAQNAAYRIEEEPNPSRAFAAKGEKVDPIGIGGQVGVDKREDAERCDHPAIGSIFLDA